MRLYYLPLERYASRYTEYLSGDGGMFESCVKEFAPKIDLYTVMGGATNFVNDIQNGVVVDSYARADRAFRQIMYLLALLDIGEITNESVIYFEDFWHPGAEQFAYACALKGVRPKVYAYCWAQSADPYDFTAKLMMPWIRHFERGWAEWLTGVFVAAPELRDMLVAAEILQQKKISVVGLPYRRQTLVDVYYKGTQSIKRQKRVVFASRMDNEKNPQFFIDLADRFAGRDGVQFTIVSGRSLPDTWNGKLISPYVTFMPNLRKADYFYVLANSTVLFNCADQDFVSFALLDALAYGCQPLCPDYLTFPAVLHYDKSYLYERGNLADAQTKLHALLQTLPPVVTEDTVPLVWHRFGKTYEHTVARMLVKMFETSDSVPQLHSEEN